MYKGQVKVLDQCLKMAQKELMQQLMPPNGHGDCPCSNQGKLKLLSWGLVLDYWLTNWQWPTYLNNCYFTYVPECLVEKRFDLNLYVIHHIVHGMSGQTAAL